MFAWSHPNRVSWGLRLGVIVSVSSLLLLPLLFFSFSLASDPFAASWGFRLGVLGLAAWALGVGVAILLGRLILAGCLLR